MGDMKYQKIRNIEFPFACVYCGDYGDSWDHVSPHSLTSALDRFDEESVMEKHNGIMVKACINCNCALLSDSPSWLFSERLKKCKERMLIKYRDKLTAYIWDEDEIRELGPNLQSHIRAKNLESIAMRERYAYSPGIEFITYIEEIQLNLDARVMYDASTGAFVKREKQNG